MNDGGALSEGVGALVVLSAALAVGERKVLLGALDRAAREADPVAVEEVLLQSYLFLGYPAALNALALWRELSGRPAPASESGYGSGAESGSGSGSWSGSESGSPSGSESGSESGSPSGSAPRPGAAVTRSVDTWAGWRARGEVVCARVYGGQYGRLRENVSRLHPDLAEWMVTEGYGKVLSRPGLALEVRELCIAVLLAGLDAMPQLRSHLRGSLLVGASPEEVEGALDLAGSVLPPTRLAVARAVWGEVRQRWEEQGAHGRGE